MLHLPHGAPRTLDQFAAISAINRIHPVNRRADGVESITRYQISKL